MMTANEAIEILKEFREDFDTLRQNIEENELTKIHQALQAAMYEKGPHFSAIKTALTKHWAETTSLPQIPKSASRQKEGVDPSKDNPKDAYLNTLIQLNDVYTEIYNSKNPAKTTTALSATPVDILTPANPKTPSPTPKKNPTLFEVVNGIAKLKPQGKEHVLEDNPNIKVSKNSISCESYKHYSEGISLLVAYSEKTGIKNFILEGSKEATENFEILMRAAGLEATTSATAKETNTDSNNELLKNMMKMGG